MEKHGLAVLIKKDDDIAKKLKEIINDDERLENIRENIQKLAKPNAARDITSKIFENMIDKQKF